MGIDRERVRFPLSEFDASVCTVDRRDQRRLRSSRHAHIDPKLIKDSLDLVGLRMFRPEFNERSTLRGDSCGMGRVSPVDEEGHDSIAEDNTRIVELPREQSSVGLPATP